MIDTKTNLNSSIWCVLYKRNDSKKWMILQGRRGFWYADPILFEYCGKKYLFTEAFKMTSQIGYLAVSQLVNDAFTIPKIIMKNSYHMSYPCVFEYLGKVYMIPETSQNATLELWQGNNSLLEWEKVGDLATRTCLADTTVYTKGKDIYLISYEEGGVYTTHIYKLDIEKLAIEEIERIESKINNKRPAGKLISAKNGILYRPTQNNTKYYGEHIILNEIISINPFKENEVKKITPKELKIGEEYSRTHTLSYDEQYCVIDALKKVNHPLIWRLKIIRKIRNKYFKFKNKNRRGN